MWAVPDARHSGPPGGGRRGPRADQAGLPDLQPAQLRVVRLCTVPALSRQHQQRKRDVVSLLRVHSTMHYLSVRVELLHRHHQALLFRCICARDAVQVERHELRNGNPAAGEDAPRRREPNHQEVLCVVAVQSRRQQRQLLQNARLTGPQACGGTNPEPALRRRQ